MSTDMVRVVEHFGLSSFEVFGLHRATHILTVRRLP